MEQILFTGKASMRGRLFVSVKYVEINADRIKIYNSSSMHSGIEYEIEARNIFEILPPIINPAEIFFVGYKGFVVNYMIGFEQKQLCFWPFSWGPYGDKKMIPLMGRALGELHQESKPQLKDIQLGTSKFDILLVLYIPLTFTAAYYFSWIGAFTMFLIGFTSYKILKTAKLKTITILLINIVMIAIGTGLNLLFEQYILSKIL